MTSRSLFTTAPELIVSRVAQMRRASRAVRVGQTAYGLGVFAKRRFRAGETVAEIRGTRIDDPDYWSAYCMELGPGQILEPSAPLRYINHSCEPNCELVHRAESDEDTGAVRRTLYLQTLAGIVPGQQLTIDYAWSADSAIPCLCGSAICRGWIAALEELNDLRHDQIH